jgi:hypothetical protein
MCVVLSDLYPCKVDYRFESLQHPQKWVGLITVFKRSNSTFIMLYSIHEMDIDYLVVDEMINILKLFDYTCMFSIGANV